MGGSVDKELWDLEGRSAGSTAGPTASSGTTGRGGQGEAAAALALSPSRTSDTALSSFWPNMLASMRGSRLDSSEARMSALFLCSLSRTPSLANASGDISGEGGLWLAGKR